MSQHLVEENVSEKKYKNIIIPEDWNLTPLSEVRDKNVKYSFTGGPFGSNLKVEHYTAKGIRVIQLQNIGDGFFNNDHKIYTSKEKADELLSCNIFPGEIIIAKMAEPLARATIVPDVEKRYLMASDGIRLKIDEKRFDKHFVLNYINFSKFRNEALRKGTGTTRQRIGLNVLGKIPILHPNFKEQQKIASILSTWDKAIELKEKLIEKKKEQKKGLMQKLLTGEVRLPGFEGDWNDIRLGEFVKLQGGFAFKSSLFQDKGIPIVRISDIETEITDSNFVYYDVIDLGDNYELTYGDIVIAMSGATTGKVGIYKRKDYAYLNQRVGKFVLIDKNKLSYDYLLYLVTSDKFKIQLKKELATGAQPNISSRQIENFKFKLPGLKEQKQIAEILSANDRFIFLVENEVNELKQQKKGLMQLLLTGKIRVKV